MNAEHIERAFAEMGARFSLATDPRRNHAPLNATNHYAFDIAHDEQGQFFELRVRPDATSPLEVELLQKSRPERHLLLLVKQPEFAVKNRFLCGFDEREWFVAATPKAVSSINAAREALKPWEVLTRQRTAGLSARQRHVRKNKVFRRQGEWFFLPEPNLVVNSALILRNEPISRGGGSKPHIVEELYRTGGEVVYVSTKIRGWFTYKQLKALLARSNKLRRSDFEMRMLNSQVYARGRVSHPDHRAIVLHQWHQVVMNTEHESPARSNLAFLD